MPEELLTYQKFRDPEIANDLAQKLEEAGICYKLDNDNKIFDPGFAYNPLNSATMLKLRPGDFKKADLVLAEYYDNAAGNIDPDHYLFSFTNDELKDILIKPDEWGKLDYQLAQKILKDRGENINESMLADLKTKRITELQKHEKSPGALIAFGYLFAIIGGFAGIIIGFILTGSKKTLPDGSSQHMYNNEDRKHGKLILAIGFGILAFILVYGIVVRSGNAYF